MLNAIKSMINRKRDFLESADIILEDIAEEEINDMVTDAEDSDSNESEDYSNDDDYEDDTDDSDEYKSDDTYQSDDDNDSLSDNDEHEDDDSGDGIGSSDDSDLDDIFNVSIDMRSNTFSDILPTPPPNASDAIAGDVMSMKLDSGYGNNDESDIMNEPLSSEESSDDKDLMDEPLDSPDEDYGSSDEDVGKEEADPMAGFQDEHVMYRRSRRRQYSFFEAITDGSDPNAGADPNSIPPAPTDPSADPSANQSSTDVSTSNAPEPPEESEVTSAVKDNVNDDTDSSSSTDYSDSSDSSSSSGGAIDKKGLFKKLTGLQKSIDDIKGSIIDSF